MLVVVENVAAGTDTRLSKQIATLLASGFFVSVITRRDDGNDELRADPRVRLYEHRAPPEAGGLLGYVIEYGMAFLAAAVLSVRATVGRRVDVVQFCQPPDIYFPLAAVLRATGHRILMDQRDLMPELFVARYGRPRSTILRFLGALERLSCRVAQRVLCVNGYLEERALASGASRDKVVVVRNGPLLARVGRATADPALKRGRTYLCCWAGMMGKQDRVDLLLRTLESYVHDLGRTDCQFAVLGDGECLAEAVSLSRELGLDDWVTFPGWVSEHELFTYLATADLGLDASLQAEVSPVKAVEYMAMGLPFVAFDLRETRAISNGAAMLAEPGDTRALASLIDQLLQDPERRADMGEVGRRRVNDELAWDRQATAYLAVIEDLRRR